MTQCTNRPSNPHTHSKSEWSHRATVDQRKPCSTNTRAYCTGRDPHGQYNTQCTLARPVYGRKSEIISSQSELRICYKGPPATCDSLTPDCRGHEPLTNGTALQLTKQHLSNRTCAIARSQANYSNHRVTGRLVLRRLPAPPSANNPLA